MTTTTFCDVLSELTKVIRITNVDIINRMSDLENTVKELSVEVKDMKASSDLTRDKLQLVEAGIEGMNLPAYSSAMLELAQKVDKAQTSIKASESQNSGSIQQDCWFVKVSQLIQQQETSTPRRSRW